MIHAWQRSHVEERCKATSSKPYVFFWSACQIRLASLLLESFEACFLGASTYMFFLEGLNSKLPRAYYVRAATPTVPTERAKPRFFRRAQLRRTGKASSGRARASARLEHKPVSQACFHVARVGKASYSFLDFVLGGMLGKASPAKPEMEAGQRLSHRGGHRRAAGPSLSLNPSVLWA